MDEATGAARRARTEKAQAQAASELWARGDHVRTYASRELRPAEVMVLVRYRPRLDVSPRMIDHASRRFPRASFELGDVRDLSRYPPGSFDVVFASFNVLDVLGDGERRRVLAGAIELLRAGGLLIMSSHNLAYSPPGDLIEARRRSLIWLMANAGRVPRRIRNRRRLARFELRMPDYAILNDTGHDHAALHYHVSRDAQARQFAAFGARALGVPGPRR